MATVSLSSGGGKSGVSGSSLSAQPGSDSSSMYRLGDYVYFENSSANAYAIRRIEELNKTPTGNVEARVICFYRRAELAPSLVAQADKHHWGDHPLGMLDEQEPEDSEDEDEDEDEEAAAKKAAVAKEKAERVDFKQREVFLSRQVETLPATLIRGKCSVTLLSEVETVASYAAAGDAFFYALVYDPVQKTLVADRGEIRIGSGYQATVPVRLSEGQDDGREYKDLEDKVWEPNNGLEQNDVDKFVVLARSVGTFARALDCSSSVKQPSLHLSAAASSRDVTVARALNLLHQHQYDMREAIKALVPTTGPMLCRDEMEDWSSSEAQLFDEAMEKCGKEFVEIQKEFLPWKSMKSIVEYFFMWKTTDRYVPKRRIKTVENESKLKQVYVPPYIHKSTRLTGPNGEVIIRGKDCDAYPKLARYSWREYKRYGNFVPASLTDDSFILDKSTFSSSTAARLAQLRPGLIIEPGSPVKTPSGKTRAAFFLLSTPLTRAARRLWGGGGEAASAKLRRATRRPGKALELKMVKMEVSKMGKNLSVERVKLLNNFRHRRRKPMADVLDGLGQKETEEQAWLVLTPKDQLPKPAKEAFPRPEKRSDGSYIYERVLSVADRNAASASAVSGASASPHPQMLYKKRPYEEASPASTAPSHHGKVARPDRSHLPSVRTVSGGRKQVISWMDAPDDLYFKASPSAKKVRKKLTTPALRRAARKPFKKVLTLPS